MVGDVVGGGVGQQRSLIELPELLFVLFLLQLVLSDDDGDGVDIQRRSTAWSLGSRCKLRCLMAVLAKVLAYLQWIFLIGVRLSCRCQRLFVRRAGSLASTHSCHGRVLEWGMECSLEFRLEGSVVSYPSLTTGHPRGGWLADRF